MLEIFLKAIATAIVKYFLGKSESFIDRILTVMEVKEKLKKVDKLEKEALAIQATLKDLLNKSNLTIEEKDKINEDIANRIGDKLRDIKLRT